VDYHVENRAIQLSLPAKNAGKFRFKKRESRLDFGATFSTRNLCFDNDTYLEWQIGYDVPVKDVEAGKAATRLTRKHFIGSNGKRKYPYELSELLAAAFDLKLLRTDNLKALCTEVEAYSSFIDDKAIEVEYYAKRSVNGINFEETSIKLPTLFMLETFDQTQIEISIQKQQYASGVQPMIYFCIPVRSFVNGADFLGRSSAAEDRMIYMIDQANAENLVMLMKVFGMASRRHQHDVVQIIHTILDLKHS